MQLELTPKQESFCLAYVATGNASEAYRKAYNTEKMAPATVNRAAKELMDNPKIAARITALRERITEQATKKLAISKEWVLEQLAENVSMAKAAEPVYDSEGNPSGEYKQNLAAANKALELIGKEIGMFVEKKEVRTGSLDDVPHEQKVMTFAAIKEEIERRKGAGERIH